MHKYKFVGQPTHVNKYLFTVGKFFDNVLSLIPSIILL